MRRQAHDLRYGADVRIKVRERDPRQLRFAGMPLAKPRLHVEFRAFLTEDRANELLAWAVENQLTTLQIGAAEAAHLARVKPATLVQVGKSHIFRIGFLVRVARALGVRVGIIGELEPGGSDEE
jgi:hypothetical protein